MNEVMEMQLQCNEDKDKTNIALPSGYKRRAQFTIELRPPVYDTARQDCVCRIFGSLFFPVLSVDSLYLFANKVHVVF